MTGQDNVVTDRHEPVMRLLAPAGKGLALAIAVLVVAGLGPGTAARAGGGRGGGDTDEVLATLDFTRFEGRARLCEGQDGTYDEETGVASGTSTGDPRLSGRFEMRFTSLDRLSDEGHLGTVRGRFEVFDPVTGKKKVDAAFQLVQRYGEELGLIVGKVADQGTLMANTRISFVEANGTFDIVGQIGGTSELKEMPALIQGGGCTGPFEPFAFDLPLSTAG